MKLPKTINFCGFTWVVKTDKTTNGSYYDVEKDPPEICIGTRDKHFVLPNFIHEVFEAACDVSLVKYRDWHCSSALNNNVMFCFNHNQLETLIQNVASAIKDLIKRNS